MNKGFPALQAALTKSPRLRRDTIDLEKAAFTDWMAKKTQQIGNATAQGLVGLRGQAGKIYHRAGDVAHDVANVAAQGAQNLGNTAAQKFRGAGNATHDTLANAGNALDSNSAPVQQAPTIAPGATPTPQQLAQAPRANPVGSNVNPGAAAAGLATAPLMAPVAPAAAALAAPTALAVGGASQSPTSAPAIQPAAPSQSQLDQFRSGTKSSFNPLSVADKAKMDALMSGQQGWASTNHKDYQMSGHLKSASYSTEHMNTSYPTYQAALTKSANRANFISKGFGKVIDSVRKAPRLPGGGGMDDAAKAVHDTARRARAAAGKMHDAQAPVHDWRIPTGWGDTAHNVKDWVVNNPGKSSIVGLGLAGVRGVQNNGKYNEGYDAGGAMGLRHGAAFGFNDAANQTRNTGFFNRLRGNYNFNPSYQNWNDGGVENMVELLSQRDQNRSGLFGRMF